LITSIIANLAGRGEPPSLGKKRNFKRRELGWIGCWLVLPQPGQDVGVLGE
jgi:hypothetical protein